MGKNQEKLEPAVRLEKSELGHNAVRVDPRSQGNIGQRGGGIG